jgi:hypothetical protein
MLQARELCAKVASMSRRLITQNLYDALLTAYRERPGNHSNAARVGGCDRRMSKRAWGEGWEKAPWAVPIKVVLERESTEARAARAKARTEEYVEYESRRELARQDAIQSRMEEGEIVQMARGSAHELLASTFKLIQNSQKLTEHLAKELNGTEGVTAARALMTLDRLSRFAGQAVATAQQVMRMERLHMGEPEAILATKADNISDSDLLAELREIEATLKTSGVLSMEEAEFDVVEAEFVENGV